MAFNPTYIAGMAARLNDVPFHNNPYMEGTQQWLNWRCGWSYAHVNICHNENPDLLTVVKRTSKKAA